ncbi:MAG: ferrochelatase [Actinomycetota bacterium]
MTAPVGVLVMAYGTADGPKDVERYYTDIRGGRPPSPEHLAELRARYAAIGNRFPLLQIARDQAAGLERELSAVHGEGAFRSYLGMKHSPPSIADGVSDMRRDGIEQAVGIVMAPHWSGMSVETYVERVELAAEGTPSFTFVRHWYDHPLFVELLASRVSDTLEKLPAPARGNAAVIFSAHSLPVRTLDDGSQRCLRCDCADSCRYRDQLRRTADLIAGKLGLVTVAIGWQSAGRTADTWWGPPLEDVVRDLAARGHPAVVVCAAGFVADHLETLYDLDIGAREVADREGIRFERTEMPNADPRFVKALAGIVTDHVALVRAP